MAENRLIDTMDPSITALWGDGQIVLRDGVWILSIYQRASLFPNEVRRQTVREVDEALVKDAPSDVLPWLRQWADNRSASPQYIADEFFREQYAFWSRVYVGRPEEAEEECRRLSLLLATIGYNWDLDCGDDRWRFIFAWCGVTPKMLNIACEKAISSITDTV